MPVTPLSETEGREGTVPPEQMVRELPKAKEGVVLELTVTVKVAVVAHCPASGVNVYTPEAWLSTAAGLHTPVKPLVDVPGKAGTVPPVQIASEVPKLNVGVRFGFTVTVKVAVVAH